MPRYKMNCLASDNMVEWLERRGFHAQATTVTGSKYQEALSNKLIEEATEVVDARTRDDIIEELADVKEVVNALYAFHDITPEQVEAQRLKKHTERGGTTRWRVFNVGLYRAELTTTKYFDEHPEYELIEE